MTKRHALTKAEEHLRLAEHPAMVAETQIRIAEAYIALAAQLSDEPVLAG